MISPYYNFGKDGKTTGALAKEEGIKWEKNIITCILTNISYFIILTCEVIGNERVEVGVHTGIDQGVRHYFLHHFTYPHYVF